MSKANWTALDCARQYLGMREVPGHQSNPAILAMLKMNADWCDDDATPWCSAFANFVAHSMGLQRTKSLRARSWLFTGKPVEADKVNGNCVVILSRGRWAPGPEVLKAPGHVGFVADISPQKVLVLGGNQSDRVSERWYPLHRVLGFRKLARA
jgi:uncharacterized protein (TIGR02594 family)